MKSPKPMNSKICRRCTSAIHPGEILQEDFIKPMGLTVYRLAKDIGVPATRLHAIVHGRRGITADTALRLERYFGLSEGYWLRAQILYDLEITRRREGSRIVREVTPRNAAVA